MAAKFPSVRKSAACKVVVVVVVAVAMIGLLFSPAGAGEALTTTALAQEPPQCSPLVDVSPDCDTWCWNQGHPGGYVKGDVCCCNSGGAGAGGGGDLAAEAISLHKTVEMINQ